MDSFAGKVTGEDVPFLGIKIKRKGVSFTFRGRLSTPKAVGLPHRHG